MGKQNILEDEIMKLYLIVFNICILMSSSIAQKGIKIDLHHRVILNFEDRIVHAEILSTENKIIPSKNLYYHWYRANDIKRTKAGFDGKLLHGSYSSFYVNRNLREKGEFKYGVKVKTWKIWYLNGELQEVANWKKGRLRGKFEKYNEQGVKTEEGFYKNDQYHGKVKLYHSKDSVEIKAYKSGEFIKSEFRLNGKKIKSFEKNTEVKIRKSYKILPLKKDKVKVQQT